MYSIKYHNISYRYLPLITIILCFALSACTTGRNTSPSLPPEAKSTRNGTDGKKEGGDSQQSSITAKVETDAAARADSPSHPGEADDLFWAEIPVIPEGLRSSLDAPVTGRDSDDLEKDADAPEIEESPEATAEGETPHDLEPAARITYDFPITLNRQVDRFIDFFQHTQKHTFRMWLERSGTYLPMIKEKLKQAGLPLDLGYLPLIESGYNLTAYSRSHAAGLWQFIPSTARHYGLKVDTYTDQRRDPLRSTKAAINYLSDLYDEFGDWQLAVAAYNGGQYKVIKGIKRYKIKNFWELAEKNYLYNETENYVPKLIAAILIAKDPEKYGFNNLQYAPPLRYDTIKVKPWTSLHKIALACDTDFGTLKGLNRELRRGIVPPGDESYEVKIPAGKKELASRNLPRVHAIVRTSYKTHVAKRDETLSDVCRRYNLNKITVLKANNLKSASLEEGQRLRIPYQTTTYALLDKPPSMEMAAEDGFILHRIKPGETLSHISLQYQVPVHQIAAWNGLGSANKIRAGDNLALYIASDNPSVPHLDIPDQTGERQLALGSDRYVVKKGDSLWEISRRYDISVERIKTLNNIRGNLIHPDTELLIEKQQPDG